MLVIQKLKDYSLDQTSQEPKYMQIDSFNIQNREFGIAKVEFLKSSRMVYLAEMHGEHSDREKLHRKFGFNYPVYPILEMCL